MNWSSLFEAYAAVYDHHSANTRELTQRWLERFQAFCEAQTLSLQQVERSHLEAFQAQLRWMQGQHGQLFTAHTVYQGVRMVRAFLRWAVRHGHVVTDPTSGWMLPRPPSPVRILSAEEVKRLVSGGPFNTLTALRNRAIVAVFIGTGLRTGECQQLTVDDVDMLSAMVMVRHGKMRTLSLPPPLMNILTAYLVQARPQLAARPEERALFVGQDGRPLGRARVNQIVQDAGRQAGIVGVTPVALRHTFAARVRSQGTDEKAVRTQLGIGRMPPQSVSAPAPKKRTPRLFSRRRKAVGE